jgi:Tfp pilus assembly protein PilF
VDDLEPLVRAQALPVLAQVAPKERWQRAQAHLEDHDRLVRLAAAELLCGLPATITGSQGRARLEHACAELVRSLEEQSDFPANATQLAAVYLRMGDLTSARRWLNHALGRDPQFVGAYLGLAELERVAGDQAASARVLEQGLQRLPEAARLHQASGLALVRLGQKREASARLARAVELSPNDAGLAFTYAVALQDQGKVREAVRVLERALGEQPEHGELLETLLRMGLRSRDLALLSRHLPTFERLFPRDPSLPLLHAAHELFSQRERVRARTGPALAKSSRVATLER